MQAAPAKALSETKFAVCRRFSGWPLDATILFGLAVLSYGVLLPGLGYYWDDWRILWIGSGRLPTNLLENYAYRPGSAWLFDFLNRFVGMDHHLAHGLALASRFFGALTLWRIVRVVWPGCPTPAFAAAALFLVYPGFTQQSIPLTYQNYHVGILLCLLSILASLRFSSSGPPGIRRPIALGAALILQVMYLLVFDGMVAWEMIRATLFLVVAASVSPSAWGAVRFAVKWMVPYVVTVLGFIVWRGVFVRATRSDVDVSVVLRDWLSLSWGQMAMKIPADMFKLILDSVVYAWPVQAWRGVDERDKVVLGGVVAATIAAALAYSRLRRWADERTSSWARGFLLVGAAALPAIAAFQILTRKLGHLEGENNRFTYLTGVAAVFLVLGLSGTFLGRRGTAALVTLLVGLSTLSNLGHGATYKRWWDAERSLIWQLAWRAPEIEPGTVVVVARARPGDWTQDAEWAHDINGALNLRYTANESPLLGLFLNAPSVDLMESLSEGRRDESRELYESYIINCYDKSLVSGLLQDPPGVLLMSLASPESTLRVVDPDHVDELPDPVPGLPPLMRSLRPLARYSRIGLIRGSGPVGEAPERLVGREPWMAWARHFQQAELARQLGHHDELVRLLKAVRREKLAPGDTHEWLVFLEAAIQDGDREAASWIVEQIQTHANSQPVLPPQLRPYLQPYLTIPRLRTWLARYSTRPAGPERDLAASLAKGLNERPEQGHR